MALLRLPKAAPKLPVEANLEDILHNLKCLVVN